MEGTRALESFLRKFGAQLRALTLRVCPGDDMSWDDFAESDEENPEEHPSDRMSIPRILALCPNLDDIILSSRWLGVHRDRRSSSSLYVHQPTGRDHSGWRHANVKRVGLYDVGMSADGFSTGLAHRRCSCTPARSWENPPGTRLLQLETVGLDGTVMTLPNMTRRQCIIDHELGILLGSYTSRGPNTSSSQLTVTQDPDHYPDQHFSFPKLESIHLLDADPVEMFISADRPLSHLPFSQSFSPTTLSHSSSPVPFSLCNRARDVLSTLDERTFWRTWSSKCTNRGITMVDGDGKKVPSQSSEEPGTGWGPRDGTLMFQDPGGVGGTFSVSGGRDADESRLDAVLDWFMGFR